VTERCDRCGAGDRWRSVVFGLVGESAARWQDRSRLNVATFTICPACWAVDFDALMATRAVNEHRERLATAGLAVPIAPAQRCDRCGDHASLGCVVAFEVPSPAGVAEMQFGTCDRCWKVYLEHFGELRRMHRAIGGLERAAAGEPGAGSGGES
jgi:hypothetical protein